MRKAHLDQLLADVAARRPVALLTWLGSGRQELRHPGETAADDPLAVALQDGFLKDKSGVAKAGDGEVFVSIHNPPLRMVMIGAVHLSQALIPLAKQAGYDITIVDPRTAFATAERFAGVAIDARWPDEALPEIGLDRRTAFLALTHDPKIDDPALTLAFAADCFYLGALGSARTHAKRCERLKGQGVTDQQLARLHAPIGLDIGAIGPTEIAISIMAEVTAVLRGKSGRHK